jgi:hypothetical protein
MSNATSASSASDQHVTASEAWDGARLLAALHTAAIWLKLHVGALNALNVFPVPDGDTGTNMSLTLQAALKDVEPDSSAATVAQGIYRGALMGARGNSGVILSQVLRGFAEGLDGRPRLGGAELSAVLEQASKLAYAAVITPVEGTMLTAARAASDAARAALQREASLKEMLEQVVQATAEAVRRTPAMLKTLRDAGVVDAGAKGLFVLLEGLLKHAKGEAIELTEALDEHPLMAFRDVHDENDFGYCTNFVLIGERLPFEAIRAYIAEQGRSVAVIGDSSTVKVHVHTERPGDMLNYAVQYGALTQIEISNMDLQRAELHASGGSAPAPLIVDDDHPAPIGVVAVVPGLGWAELFRSLNAGAVVGGGQTMNPSTEDLLSAIESLPQEQVVVLPNNANVVMAARQAAELSGRQVAVVPSRTLPQGVAAMLALNYGEDYEDNLCQMREALGQVRTIEITTAVRDAALDGQPVLAGQTIALLDEKLVAVSAEAETALEQALAQIMLDDVELLTLYYGQDVAPDEAQSLGHQLATRYPELAVELRAGDQPFYSFIVSVE